MPRLFLALWPEDGVRAQLDAARRALPRAGGRPVPARNLHLTLVFIGDAPEARAADLQARLDAVHGAPFTLVLDRAGGFPGAGVTWLAPSTAPGALVQLVEALVQVCRDAGLAPDTRPFRPHVTIARRTGSVADTAIIPVTWPVTAFCLVESTRGMPGSEYRVRARRPLIHA